MTVITIVTVFVGLYALTHWALDGFPLHRHQWDTYLVTTGMDYERCTVCNNKRVTHNGNVIHG